MKIVEIPLYDIVVKFDPSQRNIGTITCSDDCYETCPKCSQRNCIWQCDGSHLEQVETEDEVLARIQYNSAVDGILSLVLSHACAGINIDTEEYWNTIETAFESAANNLN